jgi:hypothetical protein
MITFLWQQLSHTTHIVYRKVSNPLMHAIKVAANEKGENTGKFNLNFSLGD